MKTKNRLIVVFTILISYAFFFPIPTFGGTYNKVSGLIWCTYKASCLHEIAHKIDDEMGWISHTDEFKHDIELLAGSEIERGFLNKNIQEAYAKLFVMAQGNPENMPELLRPYYDWERAEELLQLYEDRR